jgi:hypothetical protein
MGEGIMIEHHIDEIATLQVKHLMESIVHIPVKINSATDATKHYDVFRRLSSIPGTEFDKQTLLLMQDSTNEEHIIKFLKENCDYVHNIVNFTQPILECLSEKIPNREYEISLPQDVVTKLIFMGVHPRYFEKSFSEEINIEIARKHPKYFSIGRNLSSGILTYNFFMELLQSDEGTKIIKEYFSNLKLSRFNFKPLYYIIQYLSSLSEAERLTSPSEFVRNFPVESNSEREL